MMAAWVSSSSSSATGVEEKEDEDGEEEEEETQSSEGEDEQGCWEYDSTWEEEEEEEEEEQAGGRDGARHPEERKEGEAATAAGEAKTTEKRLPRRRLRSPSARWACASQSTSRRNWMAAKDMQRYRRHYPDSEETDSEIQEEDMWNLSFYRNEICFVPRGLYIEELLEIWPHDYGTMEENHSYIQWLFPLREQGMNWRAKLLTHQEIQAFRKSKEVMERFVRAYKLMLGFYGIDLVNEEVGELRRAKTWLERFRNLNQHSHNNLRITRILKCLGEMGHEHYQVQLVKFFLTETLVHKTLPRVLRSALDYFMFTVRDKQKRRELVHFAWQHFKPKHEFVWGLRKKLQNFKPQSAEFLVSQTPGEPQESSGKGEGEGKGKNKVKQPNKTHTAWPTSDGTDNNVVERPVSIPAGDSTNPHSGPVSESETSEKTRESSAALLAKASSERGSVKQDLRLSFPRLEREEFAGEYGSSGGRADGKCLKDSKKRKFDTNKLSMGIGGFAKNLTDVEKLSFNLEEVAINPEEPSCLSLVEEKVNSPVPGRGEGDSGDLKPIESVDATIKRRKVDEVALEEGDSKTSAKLDAGVAAFESQRPNCKSNSSVKRADEACQDETEIVNNAHIEIVSHRRTYAEVLLSSKISTKPGFGFRDCVSGQAIETKSTSTIEGDGCKVRQPIRREVGGNPEQKQGGMETEIHKMHKAAENKNPTANPDSK